MRLSLFGATASLLITSPSLALPMQPNASAARRYLNSDTLYDNGTRIYIRSLSQCRTKWSNSGRAKAFICEAGNADKTYQNGSTVRCNIDKVKITSKKSKVTTSECR